MIVTAGIGRRHISEANGSIVGDDEVPRGVGGRWIRSASDVYDDIVTFRTAGEGGVADPVVAAHENVVLENEVRYRESAACQDLTAEGAHGIVRDLPIAPATTLNEV